MTFTTGAFLGSYGGDTEFLPTTVTSVERSLLVMRRQVLVLSVDALTSTRMRTYSIHGSAQDYGLSLH